MMRKFKEILNYLSESSVDFPKKSLSKDVWEESDGEFSLRKDIRSKIIEALKAYPRAGILENAKEIRIVGSICSNLFDKDSDVDIHVILKEGRFFTRIELLVKEIMKWYKENRDEHGWYAGTHPFEVYIQKNPEQDLMSEGVYDVLGDKWIKRPTTHDNSYNPYKVFKSAHDSIAGVVRTADIGVGSLRRDLIDYKFLVNSLREMSPEDKAEVKKMLSSKLKEIEKDILSLVKNKETWMKLRSRFSEPSDVDKALKDAKYARKFKNVNATFKFLNRYLYLKLVTDLGKLVDDKDLTPDEIEQANQAINNFYEV